MLLARRVGTYVQIRGIVGGFIGWSIVAHGLTFAIAGLMPTLEVASLMIFVSRVLIGVEFAIQDTLLMRLLPDGLRGRVLTTDRAAEILMMSMTTVVAGWSLHLITPRSLTLISGLLSASPGLFWLVLIASGRVRIPDRIEPQKNSEEANGAELIVAG